MAITGVRLILIVPVVLLAGCSAKPTNQSPVRLPVQAPSATVTNTVSKTSTVHTAQKITMPTKLSAKLEHQVSQYNDFLMQAQRFEKQGEDYQQEGMDAASKWEAAHGEVSDSHPYPHNVQFLLDTSMSYNRKQAQALRSAASIHHHLVKSASFARYYVEAELAFDHDHIPGDLFKTDAEYLRFVKRR